MRTYKELMSEAVSNALTTGASKNNTETLQSKQTAFNRNMGKDPVVKGLKAVYNAATNLNPKGIVKSTFNQGAADGTLDGAKEKGLV